MSIAEGLMFAFDNTFAHDLVGLYEPWRAAPSPHPALLAFNEELAAELGLDVTSLRTPAGIAVLVGNVVPDGASPVAQAYAGHQFGRYSPRLGDGRALLVGEIIDVHGLRRDLHLKGSGRTPFARGGDGYAAVGPMLREYLIGEAMHALGIPTTRALAVVATGEQIARETMLPGAVLTRVAASHLRVGTFQFAAAQDDAGLLTRLADHAIQRHHPDLADHPHPYLELFDRVVDAQASLVAQWMLVGFVHGVMNTDNVTISGESIDFGPCAFMDAYDPATVFSSIDTTGRYAYGNQPPIAQWNLARLAEAMLPLLAPDPEVAVEVATEILQTFPERYTRHWLTGMRSKLGLVDELPDDAALVDELLALLHLNQIDYTSFFRSLSAVVRGDTTPTPSLLADPTAVDAWLADWLARLDSDSVDPSVRADAMDQVNPVYIARNHQVEAVLAAATTGDLAPFHALLDALRRPFDERPGLEDYTTPAPVSFAGYQTFCGT